MNAPTPDWLDAVLNAREVTDICLNGPTEAFVDRGSGMERLPHSWGAEQMMSWVLEKISSAGKAWDAKYPFVDGSLDSGHRLHVAFPPLARQGILVSLRRLAAADRTFGQPRASRWESSPYFPIIADAVVRGDSILISGATGSGKTTLASDLLEFVPSTERIIALEDTAELIPNHPHFVTLTSRPPNADGFGEVTLRALLKQALRMRPDRIVLGECRGAEVLDLLQILNTGHRGALGTLHANSPREALRRAELLCLLSGGSPLPISVIRELLATGLQWVVQMGKDGKSRTISEVWRIEGREGDTILMRQVLKNETPWITASRATAGR